MYAADPSAFKDSWKLAEGFVASEGLGMISHKKSQITIFGHKHENRKFHQKI